MGFALNVITLWCNKREQCCPSGHAWLRLRCAACPATVALPTSRSVRSTSGCMARQKCSTHQAAVGGVMGV